MSQNKVKMWVGVGAYLLSGVASTVITTQNSSAAAVAVDQSTQVKSPPDTSQFSSTWVAQAGGEGGEGGEGGAEKQPEFKDKISGTALVNALREGGYVVFFRHTTTGVDYPDQAKAEMGNCATQRNLNEQGWQDAKILGQTFQALKIPVGVVYSSQFCRAWMTADLAFSRYKPLAALNLAPSEEFTPAQEKQMSDGLKPLLTAAPAKGTNTVIVGHDDVFKALTGIYPDPPGIAYVVKPDGKGGYDVVANLLVDEWAKLPR